MARLALAICLGLLLVTSGCLGDDIRFQSQPATVDERALSETGYTLAESETRELSQDVAFGNENRTVILESHARIYEREVPHNGTTATARVVVLSTPAVDLGGDSRNPLASRATRQIVAEFRGVSATSLHLNTDQEMTVLGTQQTLITYDYAEETLGLLRMRHDGDLLIVYTSIPAGSDEQIHQTALLRAIVHATP